MSITLIKYGKVCFTQVITILRNEFAKFYKLIKV